MSGYKEVEVTKEVIERVIERDAIRNDVTRFLPYCKIKDAATKGIIDFVLWPHIIEFLHILANEDRVVVLKSKQIGLSYGSSFDTFHKTLTIEAYTSIFLSAGQVESSQLLDKPKFAYEYLPKWLQIPYGKWSESEITFPLLRSSILALPSTETPGLGMTVSRAVMDEWDFHKYPESSFATAQAAAAEGQIIGQTTVDPTKPNSLFKKMYHQAKRGENGYYPIFLGWNVVLGRDQKWYDKMSLEYIGREHDKLANYPATEAEALSPLIGRTYFEKETLQRLLGGVSKPMEERNGVTFIYQKWAPGVSYVSAADISRGTGGDSQCLVIIGRRGISAEVVAVIHSNLIATDIFADMSYKLLAEYQNPILAAEANVGEAYLNKLIEMQYPNIFYNKPDKAGWWTLKQSRTTALEELSAALRTGELVTRYEPMIDELMYFQWTEAGRPEAAEGKHDDTVMALAIGNQMLKDSAPPVTGRRRSRVQTVTTRGMYV